MTDKEKDIVESLKNEYEGLREIAITLGATKEELKGGFYIFLIEDKIGELYKKEIPKERIEIDKEINLLIELLENSLINDTNKVLIRNFGNFNDNSERKVNSGKYKMIFTGYESTVILMKKDIYENNNNMMSMIAKRIRRLRKAYNNSCNYLYIN